MNILVVADKIDYLMTEKQRISNELFSSGDVVYYLCSSMEESGYRVPVDIERKLVRIKAFSDHYASSYGDFLQSVEKLYYELCNRFEPVYGTFLKGLRLCDLLRYEMGAVLMEFVRIYNFITYFIKTKNISKVVIVENPHARARWHVRGDSYLDYLNSLPIDSIVAEAACRQVNVGFIKINAKNYSMKKLPLLKQFIIKGMKDFIHWSGGLYFRAFKPSPSKASLDRPTVIAFGSLGYLLPLIREMQGVNFLYYHPRPIFNIAPLLKQHHIRPIYGAGCSISDSLSSWLFKLKIEKASKDVWKRKEAEEGDYLFKILTRIFNEFCRYNIPLFFKRHILYSTLISRVNPQAILLDENVSALRKPFEYAAVEKNIPVFVINHGLPAKSYPPFLNKTISDNAYICIGGQYVKDAFVSYYGASDKKFIITGTPRYAKMPKAKRFTPSMRKTICLAPAHFFRRGITYNFSDYALNFKDNLEVIAEKWLAYRFKLVVKFHPGDSNKWLITNVFNEKGVMAEYLPDHMSPINVLESTGLLLTCWSMMPLEASMLGRQVIIMNNFIGLPESYFFDFVENKIAVMAHTPEELSRLLDRYCTGEDIQNINESQAASFRYEAFQDGMSSKRGADFIAGNVK